MKKVLSITAGVVVLIASVWCLVYFFMSLNYMNGSVSDYKEQAAMYGETVPFLTIANAYMDYSAPPLFYAIVLAFIGGTLLSKGISELPASSGLSLFEDYEEENDGDNEGDYDEFSDGDDEDNENDEDEDGNQDGQSDGDGVITAEEKT